MSVTFLRIEGRQNRDLVLIFAINVCLVMYMYFSNRQYLHGLLSFSEFRFAAIAATNLAVYWSSLYKSFEI